MQNRICTEKLLRVLKIKRSMKRSSLVLLLPTQGHAALPLMSFALAHCLIFFRMLLPVSCRAVHATSGGTCTAPSSAPFSKVCCLFLDISTFWCLHRALWLTQLRSGFSLDPPDGARWVIQSNSERIRSLPEVWTHALPPSASQVLLFCLWKMHLFLYPQRISVI